MKKQPIIRILALFLAFCLFGMPLPVLAGAEEEVLTDLTVLEGMPAAPSIEAPNAILIEAKTGTILYAKGANESHYPASITKVMTALLTIENCSLDDVVTFSYRATHELEDNSSGIARTEGEELSVRDCLYGLLVASANEVAQALAEHISGSLEAFADRMNEKAAELGCTNTHFANPSGLNDPEHYTTAHDMALIMRAAVSNPTFLEINSTTSYTIPATNKHKDTLPITMKHKLLLPGSGHYDYAVAGKTGYTSLAGYTLVTYAVKDDMELICVILDGPTSESRYTSTTALFDYGFNHFQMYRVSQIDDGTHSGIAASDNAYLDNSMLSLSVSADEWIVLPDSIPATSLETQFSWNGGGDGSSLATVTYSYRGVPVGTANLTVKTEEDSTFPYNGASFDSKERSNISVWTVAGILLIAAGVLLVILLLVTLLKRKKKHFYSAPRSRRKRPRSRGRY